MVEHSTDNRATKVRFLTLVPNMTYSSHLFKLNDVLKVPDQLRASYSPVITSGCQPENQSSNLCARTTFLKENPDGMLIKRNS